MGLPPRRPPGRGGWRERVLDPIFYLRAVIVVASLALVGLPLVADAVNLTLKSVSAGSEACRIVTVIDGDTVSLWCADRGIVRARLVGIDTPELFSPACLSELAAAQAAAWALRRLIWQSERIEARFDGTDRYARALVDLTLDGVPVARAMIAAGHGRAYDGGRRRGWCDAA